MKPAAIRPAANADLDAIERLETRVFAHDRLSRRSLARLLAGGRNGLIVACGEAQLLGYGLVLFRRGAQVARLYSIAVDPAAGGRGIGRLLLVACESAAAERGCRTLRLEVRADNEPAIRLYTAAGYAPFGRYLDYYDDGQSALRFQKNV